MTHELAWFYNSKYKNVFLPKGIGDFISGDHWRSYEYCKWSYSIVKNDVSQSLVCDGYASFLILLKNIKLSVYDV